MYHAWEVKSAKSEVRVISKSHFKQIKTAVSSISALYIFFLAF